MSDGMQVISRKTGRAVAVIDEETVIATRAISATDEEWRHFNEAWLELLTTGVPEMGPGDDLEGAMTDQLIYVKLTPETFRVVPRALSPFGYDVHGLPPWKR